MNIEFDSYFFPSIFHRDLRQDPRINYSTPLNIPWLRAGNRADDIGSGKLGARSALEVVTYTKPVPVRAFFYFFKSAAVCDHRKPVFGVMNSRYHANPSSDRVCFRRRYNDSTFPWRAVAHYWGEGGNKSRQRVVPNLRRISCHRLLL